MHCSLTRPSFDLKRQHLHQWHIVDRGWSTFGYNELIERDGSLVVLVPYNEDAVVEQWEVANGVRGKNHLSRHVVMAGGLNDKGDYEADYTPEQWATLRNLLIMDVMNHPDIQIGGHYQADASKFFCPGFDVPKWLKEKGFNEQNIMKL